MHFCYQCIFTLTVYGDRCKQFYCQLNCAIFYLLEKEHTNNLYKQIRTICLIKQTLLFIISNVMKHLVTRYMSGYCFTIFKMDLKDYEYIYIFIYIYIYSLIGGEITVYCSLEFTFMKTNFDYLQSCSKL